MKLLFLPFVLLLALSASAQVVTVPDSNLYAELLRNTVDVNQDKLIQVSEAQAKQVLYITDTKIKNLKGLEAFTSLVELIISIKATQLDLTPFAALRFLRCQQNELTTLDLSQNQLLEELVCHTNKLTSLDLSHNLALRKVDVYGNRLTSLEVDKNQQVTLLNLGNNPIKVLDVSRNAQLENLGCSALQINALDLRPNKRLKSLNSMGNLELKVICITDSQLVEINNASDMWRKDGFASWSTTCAPTALEDADALVGPHKDELLKVVNLLGQEVPETAEGIKLYLYRSGRVVRKVTAP